MKTLTFDLETTGLPPKDANYEFDYLEFPRIVSLAFKVNDGFTQEFIINQDGGIIPEEATAIHGITNEMAQASPHKLIDVVRLMIFHEATITDWTVGHNVYFDSSILKANLLRLIWENKTTKDLYGVLCEILHKDRRIDTMKSTIKFCALPGKHIGQHKWPKLTELHLKLFGCEFEGAHSSGVDVDITYKCFIELIRLGVIKLPEKKLLDT